VMEGLMSLVFRVGWKNVALLADSHHGNIVQRLFELNPQTLQSAIKLWPFLYDVQDPVRICSQLRQLKESNIRIILFCPEGGDVAPTFQCAIDLGMFSPEYQWLSAGAYATLLMVYMNVATELAPYRPYLHRFLITTDNQPDRFPAATAVKNRMVAKYPLYYSVLDFTLGEHYAYNSIFVLAQAIKQLRANNMTVGGMTLVDAIFNQSYDGTVGRIEFDRATGQMISTVYLASIVYLPTSKKVKIDSAFAQYDCHSKTMTDLRASIIFAGDTTTPPSDFPNEYLIGLSSSAKLAVYILAAIGILYALASAIVFNAYHGKSRSVKGSSLFFSMLMFGGASLALLSTTLNVNPNYYGSCEASAVLTDIGTVLFLAALCVKSVRIHLLFNRTFAMFDRSVTNRKMFRIVFVLLLVQGVIDAVYLGTGASHHEYLQYDRNAFYYECPTPLLWVVLRLMIPVALILTCLLMAFFVRNVDRSDFNGEWYCLSLPLLGKWLTQVVPLKQSPPSSSRLLTSSCCC